MVNMQRVSSNLTLVFKIFLPTLWIVFFATFTSALFITDEADLPFLTSPYFKYPFLFGYLSFIALMYFTVLQLKRAEMGKECYYVSNYWKTFRLIYDDIDHVSSISLGSLMWVNFHLKAKGSFGKKLTFLMNKELLKLFLSENEDVKTKFPVLSDIDPDLSK